MQHQSSLHLLWRLCSVGGLVRQLSESLHGNPSPDVNGEFLDKGVLSADVQSVKGPDMREA